MTLTVYIKRQTYILINILYDCLIYILWCIDNTCVHILSYFIVIVLFLHDHILIKIISYLFHKIIIILGSMYHSYVMYFIQYYVSYFGDVCIDVTLSWYHIIILSIMMRWLGSNCILHRATRYIIISRNLVVKSLCL